MKKNNRKQRRNVMAFLMLTVLMITTVLSGCSAAAPKTDAGTGSTVQEAVPAGETVQEAVPAEETAEDAVTGEAAEQVSETEAADSDETPQAPDVSDDYTLKKVVVLSRHNIRAPLSGEGSFLSTATPHTWFQWTADTSQLSLRGGILETMMGQYFRKWLESEELIPENYQPEDGEVRFYANAKQRTQATARYFASGMLPVAIVDIERHADYDTMDETFTPKLHFLNDAFEKTAMEEIAAFGGDKGLEGLDSQMTDAYALLEDVLDLQDSEAYKNGELTGFTPGNIQIKLNLDEEPGMEGDLKTATQLADALVLQYYEEEDPKEAAFGHDLTMEDWQTLDSIKELYSKILFTSDSVAVNVAQPLLVEIKNELQEENRRFTFLCGHDSNVASVLAAMGVEEYSLPGTVERDTPIGVKLVFEVYEGPDQQDYCRIRLVYQTTQQIRELEPLDLDTPPASFAPDFRGMEKNADGLYLLEDVYNRIQEGLDRYDALSLTDGSVEEAATAAPAAEEAAPAEAATEAPAQEEKTEEAPAEEPAPEETGEDVDDAA